MAFSINTNVGAMAALQTLNATNKNLDITSSRINTGKNVASTKDDSAKFTIAQSLRSDLGGLSAVTSSLQNAKSVTDVAVAGAEQISDLLNQMKTKAYEASDAGIATDTRAMIKADYDKLAEQVNTIVKGSEFNGVNLLDGTAAATHTKSLAALQSLTVTDTLTVANQGFEAIHTTIAGGDLSTAADAATAVATIETAIGSVNNKLSVLGAASRKVDGQLKFTSKLTDVIESGIGNLVDADLAKESAKLTALQTQQQLGLQALSIANQAPQTILSLFR